MLDDDPKKRAYRQLKAAPLAPLSTSLSLLIHLAFLLLLYFGIPMGDKKNSAHRKIFVNDHSHEMTLALPSSIPSTQKMKVPSAIADATATPHQSPRPAPPPSSQKTIKKPAPPAPQENNQKMKVKHAEPVSPRSATPPKGELQAKERKAKAIALNDKKSSAKELLSHLKASQTDIIALLDAPVVKPIHVSTTRPSLQNNSSYTPTSPTSTEELITNAIQAQIILPSTGDVTFSVTINADQKADEIKILKSDNPLNSRYVENSLPDIRFNLPPHTKLPLQLLITLTSG